MSDTQEPTPRLAEFQSEVAALKVSGGRVTPERLWRHISIGGWVAAVVIEVIAWLGSHNTSDAREQRDFIIVAIGGLTLAVIATGLFVTLTLTRYFRYWLIRLIYQDRESSDRLIEAIGNAPGANSGL